LRVVVETLRDRRIRRLHPQREIRREHPWGVLLGRVERVRHGGHGGCILGLPLARTAWALLQLPLVAVQILEEVVVPLHRVCGPRDLYPAGNRVAAFAAGEAALPAEALLLQAASFRFATNVRVCL